MTVYLVGAGPGDPGLITVRGAQLLARANVVVYDRLANTELLDLAPSTARRVDVGKTPGQHQVSQGDINQLLVELDRDHEVVVRLKGGDPLLFARGGEEARALAEAGVEVQVVPGVTSPLAAAASAGVPLTDRTLAPMVTFVTGQRASGTSDETDWAQLARSEGTLVILMGATRMGEIVGALLAGGRDADTPVVAVSRATYDDELVVRCTLSSLGELSLEAPVTVIVGAVAGLPIAWTRARG